MTPSQRARHACEGARDAKWRKAAPQVPTLKPPKHSVRPPQAWPIHPHHPKGQLQRSGLLPPAPHLPLFHTRHAEESAERPRLVTIVRPCGQSSLRKVTVLLNRRGVVSFEQLLLDVSEALGFPRWHRARVTRLYTTHAREIKGVCDFFRGEVAFVALGKARPELSAVQEALEELYPLHTHYRAAALQAWERRLRPAPDKAAKADSGYSEGTDGSETNQETHREKNTRVNNHTDRHTTAQPAHHSDTHEPENLNSDAQNCYKKSPSRKPVVQPNHLQRLHVRRGVKEPSVIGLSRHDVNLREGNVSSTTLCENCLVRRANHQVVEGIDPFSGRVPLPPVCKKQKESSNVEQEVRRVQISPLPPQPISREEDNGVGPLRLSDPLRHACQKNNQMPTFDPISDSSDVTLEDIERRYDIGRIVGDGNFAVVRQCRRRDDGRTLAVKIVERCKLIGREHMMQNELSLLGSLCHPRIVRLFAHHHTHTHSYLVMELVSGGDLFEAISDRGKFSEAEAGLMVSDVSEALNYIHCKSIVHRDIKPENLLIEHEAADICRLKLGDFGLAMVVTEPVFTICGTPTYVAPEILCETGYGVAVDVWALGVILYILLCGFPPFRSRDRDQEELFQLIKQGQLHFLSPYWDTISEEAKGLVNGLIQPDPTVRLTAEQTLLHPWVKDMALLCRQRALSVKTQADTACDGAEGDRVRNPAQRDAPETMGRHTGSKGEMPHSELATPLGATPVGATPGQQGPDYMPREVSRPEIHHSDPEFLNKDHNHGTPPDLHVDNKLLTDPLTQTDLPSQIKTPSKQVNQQQSPPRSPPSTAEKQQTTAVQPTPQHPSSNPTTRSSSPSVHQQDIGSLSPL